MYYSSYLQLEKILQAQSLASEANGKKCHDEHLFIVLHQSYELWFKQIMVELTSVRDMWLQVPLPDTDLLKISSRLNRCQKIWNNLLMQIHLAETMTPMDFLEFRSLLYPASGFQSLQFRLLETMMGIRSEDRSAEEQQFFSLRFNEQDFSQLMQAQKNPDLRHCVMAWLERIPFLAGVTDPYWGAYRKEMERMFAQDLKMINEHPHLSEEQKKKERLQVAEQLQNFAMFFDQVGFQKLLDDKKCFFSQKAMLAALYIFLHRNEPVFQLPFQILNHLIEMDQQFSEWRHRHAMLAQRMLGGKIGTGGSSGHEYLLKTAIKHRPYVDLVNLNNFLIPRSFIPPRLRLD